MKASTWFRIAFVGMLLFAAGHTVGFLTFRAPTVQGQAVRAAMDSVTFAAMRGTYSYGEYYVGFGLTCTLAMLFQAWLTWMLVGMAERGVAEARSIGWAMCVLQVVSVGMSLRYFGAPPSVLATVEAGLYAMGALRMGQAAGVHGRVLEQKV